MNNSELFKTLNNVAETKRQIKQEEIAKKMNMLHLFLNLKMH